MLPLRVRGTVYVSSLEHWRFWAYTSWIVTFAVGILITSASGVLDQYEGGLPPAFNVTFGIMNVCVYFDFAPANMVLPVLYAFDLVIWMAYFWTLNILVRAQLAEGMFSERVASYLMWSHRFEAFTVLAFSLIWAVSPINDLEDPLMKAAAITHTVPYMVLQYGLCSLAISTAVHHHVTNYWEDICSPSLAKFIKKAQPVYCVLFAIDVLLSCIFTSICLANSPWSPPKSLTRVYQPVSLLVFLFGLVVPFVKETVIVLSCPQKASAITFSAVAWKRGAHMMVPVEAAKAKEEGDCV